MRNSLDVGGWRGFGGCGRYRRLQVDGLGEADAFAGWMRKEAGMLNSTRELREKIRLGEDSFLELKEVRLSGNHVIAPSRDSLSDELAALANTRGGVCVLGVEDKAREVTGIPWESLDGVEAFVGEVCNDSVEPPLLPMIERLTLANSLGIETPVLKVELARSLFVHRSAGGYFHRVGSSKREMTTDYLARLFQQRSQARMIRFDEQTVAGGTLADLNEALWRRFETRQSGADARDAFLHKLGLARQDEEMVWRPTVAGVLMASEDPRRFLPNAFIQGGGVPGQHRHAGRRCIGLSTRRGGYYGAAGPAGDGRVPFRCAEHADGRTESNRAHGCSAVRHDGDL